MSDTRHTPWTDDDTYREIQRHEDAIETVKEGIFIVFAIAVTVGSVWIAAALML